MSHRHDKREHSSEVEAAPGSGPVSPGCLENPEQFVLLLSLCLFPFLLYVSSSESKNLPLHEPLDGQPLNFLVKLIIEAGYI